MKRKILYLLGSGGPTSVPEQWGRKLKENMEWSVVVGYCSPGVFASALKIITSVSGGRFSIVHANGTHAALLVLLLLPFMYGTQIVLHFHRSYDQMSFKGRVIHYILSQFSDLLLANSTATLASLPKTKVFKRQPLRRSVYNGVDLSEASICAESSALNAQKEPIFLVLGRMVPEKNVVGVLSAFASLIKRHGPNYRLNLVGGGVLYSLLERLIDENELARLVNLTGEVSRSEVYQLLCASDYLVIPSLTEGFCNVAVEGMSQGCRILYTPIPALCEVIGDAGLKMTGVDAKSICAGMEKALFEDDSVWFQRTEIGKVLVSERYSMSSCVSELCATYNELLSI